MFIPTFCAFWLLGSAVTDLLALFIAIKFSPEEIEEAKKRTILSKVWISLKVLIKSLIMWPLIMVTTIEAYIKFRAGKDFVGLRPNTYKEPCLAT